MIEAILRLNDQIPRLAACLCPEPELAMLNQTSSHSMEILSTTKQLLDSKQTLTSAFIDKLNKRLLLPLAQGIQRDLRELREERKLHEKAVEKYEAAVARYTAMGKGKDPNAVREEAFQLYEARVGYMDHTLGYMVNIER